MAWATLRDLEDHPRLHLTYFEAQKRVAMMGEVNPTWAAKTGRRGSWMVSPAGIEVLIRMRELEADGHSLEASLAIIREETTPPEGVPQEDHEAETADRFERELADLRRRNEQLQREVDRERSEKDRVLSILENMTAALPRPRDEEENDTPPTSTKRQRWWEFIRGGNREQ